MGTRANKPGFRSGDWVIYRKTKQSLRPGHRAQDIQPFRSGDGYSYVVDKFWIVVEVNDDGTLLLRTRRNKLHSVSADDPNLRKAGWWQRFVHRDRFEAIERQAESDDDGAVPKESP